MRSRILPVLWMALLVIVGPVAAQDTLTPLEKQLEEIEALTRAFRELDELAPVEIYFPQRDELRAYLIDSIDQQLSAEDIWKETQFYAAFDFLPADIDLRQTYLHIYESQVAGFYDPETKRMNVILVTGERPGDSLPLLEKIAYSHEYVHALQDQHFGLREIGFTLENDTLEIDQLLALQALIEGDATSVMNDFTLEITRESPLLAALQLLLQGGQAGGLTLPPGTPAIIQEELLYPYLKGLVFVQALYRDGGWARVDQAYRDLPQSTEQILHPERYLNRDDPQVVTVNIVSLGAGWEVALERTLGEFYLRQYLDTQLTSREAESAAAGWDGDRFAIYYNAEIDQRAWALRIVWDTPEDAQEFAAAFRSFGDTRLPDGDQVDSCRVGAAETLCINTDEAASLVVYAPTESLARALLAGS